jgi:hypothetical protein
MAPKPSCRRETDAPLSRGTLRVQVAIERLGERTPAWRELWRRLLSPPPCQSNDLPLDCEQDDAGEGLAGLTSG